MPRQSKVGWCTGWALQVGLPHLQSSCSAKKAKQPYIDPRVSASAEGLPSIIDRLNRQLLASLPACLPDNKTV